MKRKLLIALALLMAGGLLWLGLGALENGMAEGTPPAATPIGDTQDPAPSK